MRGRKRKGEVPIEDTEYIITMYEEDVSLENIIAMYDNSFTPYVLREFLVSEGVTIRPRGRKRVVSVDTSNEYIEKAQPVKPFYSEWR